MFPILNGNYLIPKPTICKQNTSISICIAGEQLATIKCEAQTFEIAWHPRRHLLAIAGDEKDRYDSSKDAGIVKVWGFSGEANLTQKPVQNVPKPLMAMSL